MNDKIIIKTISKIYAVIFTSFISISIIFSIFVLFLQEGIYIDRISIPNLNLKIEQLYIKYNEKIDFSIKNLQITPTTDKSENNFNFSQLNKEFSKLIFIKAIFKKISINIHIQKQIIQVRYKNSSLHLFTYSDNLKLKMDVHFNKQFIIADIQHLQYLKRKISVQGKIICDKNLHIYSILHSNINNEIFLDTLISLQNDKILYKISSQKEITTIKYLVDSLPISETIKYWIRDAVCMSSLHIDKAIGWIDINNISNAYKNIDIKATIQDLDYTYNKKLDSVHTKYTLLFFNRGNLSVKPKEAYSYNQFLDKSWVNIDFTKKTIPLSIYLRFNGILNKDVLKILQTYTIKLPFLQKTGKVNTDLTIDINLKEINVNAYGAFYTKKANFDYAGLNLDIFDAKIILNGSKVTINNMYATYKDILKSEVDVSFDAKTVTGFVDFRVDEVSVGGISSFNPQPLKVRYNIIPNNNSIDVEPSRWLFANETINIDKLSIPFNYETMILKIPTTRVSIDKIALLYASGQRSLKTGITSLDIDLLRLSYNNLLLGQYKADLKLTHDKNLTIQIDKKVVFKMNGIDFNLQNTDISIDKESNLHLQSFAMFQSIGSSFIDLNYNITHKRGDFYLKNTHLNNNSFSKINKTKFQIMLQDNNLTIDSKDLNLSFYNSSDNWLFHIGNLKNIAIFSPLLQSLHLTNGDIFIQQQKDEKYLDFNASVNYPYTILYNGNKAIKRYNLYGNANIKKDIFNIKIKNLVNLNINKNNIHINMQNVGIDVKEALNALENNSTTKKKSDLNIKLNAKNCYLYIGKNRKVLSNTMKLKYKDNILTSQLNYKDGEALFKLYKNKFELTGQNFNDNFMENIFALSKFKGGSLDFMMAGSLNKYDGVLNINNTTILDYKLLNNILAFVNTIPSLLTFSLPGYNQKGLKVNNAYMNFSSNKNDINITDINLDSQEIDIKGRGTVNFKTDKIDVKLNLITDLASAISQVPVVGYILFGKDSISTSLKIEGALQAPVVTSLFAKELVVAPLNIIKRTILLPVHLFSSNDKNSSK